MLNNLFYFKEVSSGMCSCFLFFFIVEKFLNLGMYFLCFGFFEFCYLDYVILEGWLRRIMLGVEDDKGNIGKMVDNRFFL